MDSILSFFIRMPFQKNHFWELFWVAIGQVLIVSGGLITIKILTVYLSPSQYGEIALANTVVSLVGLLTFGPLANAIMRYWSICRENGQISELFSVSQSLILFISLGVSIIGLSVFIFAKFFKIRQWELLVIPVIVLSIFSGQNTIIKNFHLAARRRIVYALAGGLQPWLYAVLAVLMMTVFGIRSSSALWGAVMAMFFVVGGQFFLLQMFHRNKKEKRNSNTLIRSLKRDVVLFSMPFVSTGIVSWLQSASDRWILQWFSDSTTVGFYAVLFQIGYYPVSIINGMLVQYLYPIILDRVGDGKDWNRLVGGIRLLAWGITGFILISIISLAVGFVFHNEIFQIATAKQFWVVSNKLWLVMLWAALFGLGQILGLIPIILNRPQILVLPKIIAAIFMMILSAVFVRDYGLSGVIVAGIASSFILFSFIALISFRSLRSTKKLIYIPSI
jgi:O-antigen/teichoic acid export membrane protein